MISRTFAAAGAQAFLSRWIRAAEADAHAYAHATGTQAPPEPDRWTGYKPAFFSPEQFTALEAFTEILIPSDETPGAREAHVAPFIDFVVNAASEYAPEIQENWRSAMEWLDTGGFRTMTPEARLQLVQEASAPERDGSKKHPGFAAYQLIKDMTVRAFYTSRVGLVDVLEYKGLAYLNQFPGCTHAEHHKV
jgi:hypothetical protein